MRQFLSVSTCQSLMAARTRRLLDAAITPSLLGIDQGRGTQAIHAYWGATPFGVEP
jgi:hypothetical protein